MILFSLMFLGFIHFRASGYVYFSDVITFLNAKRNHLSLWFKKIHFSHSRLSAWKKMFYGETKVCSARPVMRSWTNFMQMRNVVIYLRKFKKWLVILNVKKQYSRFFPSSSVFVIGIMSYHCTWTWYMAFLNLLYYVSKYTSYAKPFIICYRCLLPSRQTLDSAPNLYQRPCFGNV